MNQLSIIYVTTPDKTSADYLARELVSQRLAACVQIDGPVLSTYQWEGKLEQEEEYRLSIKTRPEQYSRVESFILENHPYDTPQILAVPAHQASREYAQWVKNQTQ